MYEFFRCQVGDHCMSKNTRPADGTRCGDYNQADNHKWCLGGRCVPVSHRNLQDLFPIHGSWGEWSPWSSCSHSCDTGISVSQRQCDHPEPVNGGSYCSSKRRNNGIVISDRRHRVCKITTCTQKENLVGHSERDAMCIRFTRSSNFVSFDDPDKPCILKCRSIQVAWYEWWHFVDDKYIYIYIYETSVLIKL